MKAKVLSTHMRTDTNTRAHSHPLPIEEKMLRCWRQRRRRQRRRRRCKRSALAEVRKFLSFLASPPFSTLPYPSLIFVLPFRVFSASYFSRFIRLSFLIFPASFIFVFWFCWAYFLRFKRILFGLFVVAHARNLLFISYWMLLGILLKMLKHTTPSLIRLSRALLPLTTGKHSFVVSSSQSDLCFNLPSASFPQVLLVLALAETIYS